MKIMRKLRILGLILLVLGGVSAFNKTQAQPGVNISFQTFYEELSPYGQWIRSPQYGSVWVPDAPRGFQPYSTAGYWEVTEYGNTWVSDYDWGWAPFHYGRWSYDDFNGWFWIPGYEWGPAWVNWRSGGGYYGWAPLGPGVNVNVSINIPSFWWVFVPQRYITSPRWHAYCAPRNRVSHYYGRTTIINNYYYNNNRTYVYGPRRDEIERVTRRSVTVREIDPSRRGRVVVAGNSRGNDRYESSRGSNNRENSRYEGSRETANHENNRIESLGDNNRSSRENVPARRGSTIDVTPERSNRGSTRANREYEATRQPERSPERSAPVFNNDRGSRSERSSEPAQRSRGSYEAPAVRESRPARSAPEPRGDAGNRSSQGSAERGSRGGSDRSSRSPR